ncbi:MAG: hypothetical protein B7Z66_04525 [Chromatiales bacterium 21-64-14]|nr:MAG: hypothetical protein B7Z66_04525 [Chromatiales bacterium 21-64-14]HQU14595.1 hypothetical protein [Gammaproteobacteria bacterium]
MKTRGDTEPEYVRHLRGSFQGILRWEQLDRFWEVLRQRAGDGWYLYAVGETPPTAPAPAETLLNFVEEITPMLRREHGEDYCGIVYVDDFDAPTFVKIYDPNNLGVSCGSSDNPPLPGWILSRLVPTDLHALPPPGGRRRWWRRLFAP